MKYFKIIANKENMCPECGGQNLSLSGNDGIRQIYKCRNCDTKFPGEEGYSQDFIDELKDKIEEKYDNDRVEFRKDWKNIPQGLEWINFYRSKAEAKNPSKEHLVKLITTFIVSPTTHKIYTKEQLKGLTKDRLKAMWMKIRKPSDFLNLYKY